MTSKEILNLAELCKLEFSDQEIAKLQKEFTEILKTIAPIKEIKLDGALSIQQTNISSLREDKIEKSLTQNEVFKNAPNNNGQYFIVPQVVE